MSHLVPYYRNVYVASLPSEYTCEELRELFEPYGNIISCTVKRDKETRKCKGYGFVLFEKEQDASNAVIALQGYSINYIRIQVRLARAEASAKKVMPIIKQQHALLYAQQQQ
uniref:CUGBP Elav-like family member 3 n=1 Tax=Lygus hesperus TaxID=30085 RepID=A0A0A9WJB9_LYGHE